VYRLRVIVPFGRGALYLHANWKPCIPNLLDELLKGFIVIPTDLPRKGVKRIATSGESVNQGFPLGSTMSDLQAANTWLCTTKVDHNFLVI